MKDTITVEDGSLFTVSPDRLDNCLRIIDPDGGDELVELIAVNGNTLEVIRSNTILVSDS